MGTQRILIIACCMFFTACGGSGLSDDSLIRRAEKADEVIYVLDQSLCSWPMMTAASVGLAAGSYTGASKIKAFNFEFSIDRNFEGIFKVRNEKHRMSLTACTSPQGDDYLNFQCEVAPGQFQNFPVKVSGSRHDMTLWAFWFDKSKSAGMGFPVRLFQPAYRPGYVVLTPRNDDDVEFLLHSVIFKEGVWGEGRYRL